MSLEPGTLPKRPGRRPATTGVEIPHDQLEQFSPPEIRAELLSAVKAMPGVFTGRSQVSHPTSIAFRLYEPRGPWEAFLTPTRDEFGHVHVSGFLHLMLPPPVIGTLLEADWIELHPITRRPEFPDTAVMFYAPRDHDELAVALSAVDASRVFAATPPAGS